MEGVAKYMQDKGALIWVYLDDFLLLGHDEQELQAHTKMLVELLQDLGVQVNMEKSVLYPTQSLQYLGFLINLLLGVVEIPPHKITVVMSDVSRMLKLPQPTARKLASVLGRLRSLLFAMPQMKLWTDLLSKQIHWLLTWGGWESAAPFLCKWFSNCNKLWMFCRIGKAGPSSLFYPRGAFSQMLPTQDGEL